MAATEHDRETLLEIRDILQLVHTEITELRRRLDSLEAEFLPLARRAGRLASSAAALPVSRWRKGSSNGAEVKQ